MRRVRLMGAWEIQHALGLKSRSRAYELARRKGFPEPADDTLRGGAVWYEDEVMEWIRDYRAVIAEEPES